MDTLLFDLDEFNSLYSCTNFTSEEWGAHSNPNRLVSELYVGSGAIYLTVYLPVLLVMAQPRLIGKSVYKIMFFLGALDIMSLIPNSIIAGVLQWKGYIFCMAPVFNYQLGSIVTGLWTASCVACLVLLLNRLFETGKNTTVFGGINIYFWLLLPLIAFLSFFWLSKPLLFSSHFYAFSTDPHLGIPGMESKGQYEDVLYNLNNIVYSALVIILVPIVAGLAFCQKNTERTEKANAITRQAIFLCLLKLIPALAFSWIHLLPYDPILLTFGQIFQQMSHGLPAFVYLAMNETIRSTVFHIFGLESTTMKKGTSSSDLNENDLEFPPEIRVWRNPSNASTSNTSVQK
ncbi:hypothetical protein QR680_016526 [Steinernema hermaphroditum]|uniref:Uncharacterized protein n=1 Tax=Steinernema hermaphroditum TaxID=289476 RepID=A0AA39HCH7_9BILA|nr:hypothetical protein QR680_016526 [Steinernema hermaphroditum]